VHQPIRQRTVHSVCSELFYHVSWKFANMCLAGRAGGVRKRGPLTSPLLTPSMEILWCANAVLHPQNEHSLPPALEHLHLNFISAFISLVASQCNRVYSYVESIFPHIWPTKRIHSPFNLELN
jgi:hypothetical protein